jgi:CP family cyanate transporter-like MFS transporter
MSSIEYQRPAKNDWSALILTALSLSFLVSMPTAGVSVLFKEIAGDLNLDVIQIGSVWGIVSLGSIFITPLGGIVSDWLGVERSTILIGLLSGLTSALRGFSDSFLTLMATTFLWGLVTAAVVPGLTMAASLAATEQRQGLAQGFVGIGGGIGLILGSMISATVVSPLVGGWRNVFLLYGGLSILTSLIWLFKVRSSRSIKVVGLKHATSFSQALIHILKMKEFWLIGFALMTYQGCTVGTQGYLPYFLQGIGWSTVAAGGALAVFSGVGTTGVLPLTMLSDRLGSRKTILFVSFLTTTVGVGVISLVQGVSLWILVTIAGFFYQVNTALLATMFIEKAPAGASYAGTGLGLAFSMGLVGRAVFPPIGNSLAGISNFVAWPFVFWAGLSAAGMIILGFMKETGRTHRAGNI